MAITLIGQSSGSADTLEKLAGELDRLERAGIDYVELMPDRYWVLTGGAVNHGRLALLRHVLNDRALRYTMHAPFALNLFDHRHPGLQREMFTACVETAAELGAEVIVYHSGRREPGGAPDMTLDQLLEHERAMLHEMGDLAAASGVRIAVENMTPTSERKAGMPDLVPYGADLRVLADQIARVSHPNVGICLDFGHAWLFERPRGGSIVEAALAAAPYVNHFHIHDNFGRPDSHPHYAAHPDLRAIGEADLHMPIGWGTIPLTEIFQTVSFPRDPIALSESQIVDDAVLAANVEALRELVRVNAEADRALV